MTTAPTPTVVLVHGAFAEALHDVELIRPDEETWQ